MPSRSQQIKEFKRYKAKIEKEMEEMVENIATVRIGTIELDPNDSEEEQKRQMLKNPHVYETTNLIRPCETIDGLVEQLWRHKDVENENSDAAWVLQRLEEKTFVVRVKHSRGWTYRLVYLHEEFKEHFLSAMKQVPIYPEGWPVHALKNLCLLVMGPAASKGLFDQMTEFMRSKKEKSESEAGPVISQDSVEILTIAE